MITPRLFPVHRRVTGTITQILSEEGASGSKPERIARSTGAGLVVTGSIVAPGDSLEVRAQLLDPAEGRVLDYFEAGRSHRSMPATALGPIRPRPEPKTMKVRALVALGRIQDAMSALQEGMALPREDWSPADLQIQAGLELRWHGHPDLREAMILGALEWLQAHEDAPDKTYSATQAHLWIGQPDSAVILFRELVRGSPGTIDYHGYLGSAHAAAGGSREAKDVHARLKEWQEPHIRGRHLYWSAAISAWLGEEDQALSLLRDAIAQGITPSSLRENEAFRPLWTHPSFEELLEPRGG